MLHDLPPAPVRTAVADAVRAGLPAAIAELASLVRIPSVSWDGFDEARVGESAEAVAELLRGTGAFDRVSVERAEKPDGTPGQPAVLATRAPKPGAATVLLYAHHDVQPPGRDADWDSPPFEPTLRPGPDGDRLFGRGTADDKAGVIVHVAAIRVLLEVLGADPDLGIAVFIEGEEEFGSASFADFLARHREALAADAIVVADSGNWSVDVPGITVALRGNAAVNLTIRTLEHASHSGMYGGVVPDAMMAAAKLFASFWDEDGAVAVAGLTRREAATPDYEEARLRAEAGVPDRVSLVGRGALLDRIWNQPAITVTGMDLPSVQHASNTLIPAVRARVSTRVAPGQRAGEAFEALRAHILANAPWGAIVEFEEPDLGEPFLVDAASALFDLTKSAMAEAWGSAPVEMGVGGSIPFIADLVEVFPEAQILITGVEDAETRAHSPNESLHLGVLRRAIEAEALLLVALCGAP